MTVTCLGCGVDFDSLTMLKQLLGGLNFKDPRSWPKLVRGVHSIATMSGLPIRCYSTQLQWI